MNKLAIAFTDFPRVDRRRARRQCDLVPIDGQRVRIERPSNCSSLDCLNIATQDLSNKSRQADRDAARPLRLRCSSSPHSRRRFRPPLRQPLPLPQLR